MHEELPIQELPVGHEVRGKYRGEKFHEVEGEVMGRVFLDTEAGQTAVGGNGHTAAQLEAFKREGALTDGDSIIVVRVSEDSYTVVKED